MRFHLQLKPILAAVVVALAFCIWGRQLWQHSAPNEAALRDINGISATVLSVQATERGYCVRCRIENQRNQSADQVVMQVVLVDTDDQIIASNPLASTANLAAGQLRDVPVLILASNVVAMPAAKLKMSLVRWSN